jgi:hypothetical protein
MSGGKIIPLIVARDEALKAELREQSRVDQVALMIEFTRAIDLVNGRIEILRMEIDELKQRGGQSPS